MPKWQAVLPGEDAIGHGSFRQVSDSYTNVPDEFNRSISDPCRAAREEAEEKPAQRETLSTDLFNMDPSFRRDRRRWSTGTSVSLGIMAILITEFQAACASQGVPWKATEHSVPEIDT